MNHVLVVVDDPDVLLRIVGVDRDEMRALQHRVPLRPAIDDVALAVEDAALDADARAIRVGPRHRAVGNGREVVAAIEAAHAQTPPIDLSPKAKAPAADAFDSEVASIVKTEGAKVGLTY